MLNDESRLGLRKFAANNVKKMERRRKISEALFQEVQKSTFVDIFDKYMFPDPSRAEELEVFKIVGSFLLSSKFLGEASDFLLDELKVEDDERILALCKMMSHTVLSIADKSCPSLVSITEEVCQKIQVELVKCDEACAKIEGFYSGFSRDKLRDSLKTFGNCSEVHDSIVSNGQDLLSLYLHLGALFKSSINSADCLLANALDCASTQDPIVIGELEYNSIMNKWKDVGALARNRV